MHLTRRRRLHDVNKFSYQMNKQQHNLDHPWAQYEEYPVKVRGKVKVEPAWTDHEEQPMKAKGKAKPKNSLDELGTQMIRFLDVLEHNIEAHGHGPKLLAALKNIKKSLINHKTGNGPKIWTDEDEAALRAIVKQELANNKNKVINFKEVCRSPQHDVLRKSKFCKSLQQFNKVSSDTPEDHELAKQATSAMTKMLAFQVIGAVLATGGAGALAYKKGYLPNSQVLKDTYEKARHNAMHIPGGVKGAATSAATSVQDAVSQTANTIGSYIPESPWTKKARLKDEAKKAKDEAKKAKKAREEAEAREKEEKEKAAKGGVRANAAAMVRKIWGGGDEERKERERKEREKKHEEYHEASDIAHEKELAAQKLETTRKRRHRLAREAEEDEERAKAEVQSSKENKERRRRSLHGE